MESLALRMDFAHDGRGPLSNWTKLSDTFGNARFSDCPTVPVIAPSCEIVVSIMMSQHQRIQCAPNFSPGNSLMAPSVGLPDEIA